MANHRKKALIVVDVQNDFCPGGSLAVAHGDEVVAPLNKLMEKFLDRGEPVFKTRDWHPAKTKHFAAYGGTWPVHCVQGTRGARFVYIDIGTYAGQRDTPWSRRLKIPLAGITQDLIRRVSSGAHYVLEARVPGTAADGGPACASVREFSGWKPAR